MRQEWRGAWWRPGNPDDQVGGVLVVDHDCKLELFGALNESSEGVLPVPEGADERIPLLHGWGVRQESRNIERLSIIKAWCGYSSWFSGGIGTTEWHGAHVVTTHLDPDVDLGSAFTGIRVELDSLAEWAGASGATRQADRFPEQLGISAERELLAEAHLEDGYRIRVEQTVGEEPVVEGRSHLLHHPVWLTIEAPEPCGLDDLSEDHLEPCATLLWLATGEVSVPRRTWVKVRSAEPRWPEWVELWTPLLRPRSSGGDHRSVVGRHEMLFGVDDLPGGFTTAVAAWVRLWQELRSALLPVIGRGRAPFTFANDRFTSAVAAIEAYDRRQRGNERDLQPAQHRARVARLREVLDEHAPELAEWAIGAAAGQNRISLGRRLAELLDRSGELGTLLVGEHSAAFAEGVEESRNGHAHARRISADLGREGEPLYRVAAGLLWLLRFNLLIDLGYERDDATRRMLESSGFRQEAAYLRNWLDENIPPASDMAPTKAIGRAAT